VVRTHVAFTYLVNVDDTVVSSSRTLPGTYWSGCRVPPLHRAADFSRPRVDFHRSLFFASLSSLHLTNCCVRLVCASPLSPTYRTAAASQLFPLTAVINSAFNHALAILAIISKVLEFFRKMVRKVTYGKRPGGNDKRPLPYDIDSAIENDDSRKRSKTDDDELEKLRFPGRQAKKSSLLKKSLHSGPVSFSNDDGDIDPAPKKRTNVFDKVLKEGRYQAEMPDQSLIQIYQDRKRNSYLPTPPAEAQRKAHQQARRDATFSRSKGIASNGGPKTSNKPATPAQTSQLFERVIEDEQPKQAYKPKAYKADETAAPRKDITGDRLSSKSKEAEM
jgi:hypothetical protein